MGEDWLATELEIVVADYFDMLKEEIAGVQYNKAAHSRSILPSLNHRTKGAVEFKRENISAVLIELGLPWINGYKPARNYQGALAEKVVDYIRNNLSFESNFRQFAEKDTDHLDTSRIDFSNIIEDPPKPEGQLVLEPEMKYTNPVKINYLEVEQNNARLGKRGEELVIDYEKWRLINAGKDSLAETIEWIAQDKGDWLGYDVLSKNTNGTDRYIEVKTTKQGKDAPIFFTKNEYDFSHTHVRDYYLYRVFNLAKNPKLFIANGKYEDFCQFQAVKFKGYWV